MIPNTNYKLKVLSRDPKFGVNGKAGAMAKIVWKLKNDCKLDYPSTTFLLFSIDNQAPIPPATVTNKVKPGAFFDLKVEFKLP